MMPKGWKDQTLQKSCRKKISYGIVQTGESVVGGTPCVRVVDMTSAQMDPSLMITTSDEINRANSKTRLELNEIMFALRGEIGLARIANESLVNCNLTRGVARISPDESHVAPMYLLHFIGSTHFRKDLLRRVNGSALQEVPLSELKQVSTLLPPLPEQKKIARILSTWDKAIETVEKLIENSTRQKKALMQQLLTGKKRLPGFSGEWKSVSLGDAVRRVTRKNTAGVTRVLTASGEHGLVDQKDYFNRSVAAESLDNYYHLKRGEFAYNRSSMKGYPYGAIKRLNNYDAGVLSPLYMCFTTRNGAFSSDFYSHYFESGALNRGLRRVVQVGARAHGMLNIITRDFFSLDIPHPPRDEQTAIANIFNRIDAHITMQKEQLASLASQKKALMQQLLTGKRRVKIDEEDAKTA